MVSCKDVGARLAPFLRGELSFSDRLAIHRHLARCEQCARQVERGRDAMDVSKSALASAVDPIADEVPEQLVRAILVTCRGAH
jgi:anti-sigma factor RsiW